MKLKLKPKKKRPYKNKVGYKVSGDVCLVHCEPLMCRHGCDKALVHKCKESAKIYFLEEEL